MSLTIEVEGLRFERPGGFCLSIPTWRVEAGARVALVGPSGCGKTTLIHLLAGVLQPLQGHIRLGGVQVEALGDAARRALRLEQVGVIFQDLALVEHLDVEENLLLPALLNPRRPVDAALRQRARALARAVGLGQRLDRYPEALSGGERQRVAVARALVTAPALILADEPTENLDAEARRQTLDALLGIQGATVVVVTHDAEVQAALEEVVEVSSLVGEVP